MLLLLLLAKTDVKSAFQLIPVSPSEYRLFGFKHQGWFYFDKCLQMGCSSSCNMFECFSCAVEWTAHNKYGISRLTHYLNDILIIAQGKEQCMRDRLKFQALAEYIGLPLVPEKTVTLDTKSKTATLPVEKVEL